MSKKDERRPDELAAYLDKHPDTQFIELLQPDMLGILRGKRVVRDEFAKPFKDGANFPGATVLLDAKGATFDYVVNGGRDGDPDVISSAIAGSLVPVPWAHVPTAQLLLAMNTAEGLPFFADPRQVLRHARPEERRVGKECCTPCRSRWSPYHSEKKKVDGTIHDHAEKHHAQFTARHT